MALLLLFGNVWVVLRKYDERNERLKFKEKAKAFAWLRLSGRNSTSYLIVFVILLSGLTGMGILLSTQYVSHAAGIRVLDRLNAVNSLLYQSGYGGAIHHFKNYVIRANAENYQQAYGSFSNVVQDTELLLTADDWAPPQKAALNNFNETMKEYLEVLEVSRKLVDAGERDIRLIDNKIRIDDTSAVGALGRLIGELNKQANTHMLRSTLRLTWAAFFAGAVMIIATIVVMYLARSVEKSRRETLRQYNELLNSEREKNELKHSKALLVESAQAYERANEEHEQFSQRVSHDIRAPLRRIKMFGRLAAEDLAQGNVDEMMFGIECMRSQADNLEDFVNELLDLARSELVDEPGDIDSVDLPATIERSLQQLSAVIDEHGAHVSVDCSVVSLNINKTRLGQILHNLISNACKYGDADGPKVLVSAHRVDGQIELVVADNGPGISPENQKQLFGLFKRFDPTRAEGNGLGLSIVKRHVERLGGSIHYRDGSPGAKFVVRFNQSSEGDQTVTEQIG